MDCDAFQRHLGMLLDGKAGGRLSVALRGHALHCADCRLLEKTRRQLRELVRKANSDVALPRFVTSILEHVAKAKVRT